MKCFRCHEGYIRKTLVDNFECSMCQAYWILQRDENGRKV